MAALVSAALTKLWPSFLADPAHSLPAFKAAVAQEVRAHAQASGALALRQYRRQRAAAGETSTFRTTLATLPSVDDVAAMVDTALAGVDLGADVTPEGDTALADAKARLAKSAEDVVFDTGVRTILGNAGQDRAARGYARIPEPNACAFCLMLATRGAVYKADRRGRRTGDSFAASNAKFTDHPDALPSSIKVHDNCRCHPEPVFGVYEAPARVREAEDTYKTASKAGGGRKAVSIRFRQMVEGRYHPEK